MSEAPGVKPPPQDESSVVGDDGVRDFIDRLYAATPRAWLTQALVLANVLVFGALCLAGGDPMRVNGSVLIEHGALYGPAVLQGQPWRIVSATFLHGGLLHLAMNMLALWQAGALVERLFGRAGYAVLYAGCGVLAGLTSLWWKPGVLSVGASGAIFGVYGALLAHLWVARHATPLALLRDLRSSTLLFIGFSLFAGFSMPGIDNASHLGGLAAGLLLGAGMARVPGTTWQPWQMLRALGAWAVAAALGAALWDAAQPAAQGFRQRAAVQRTVQALAAADEALSRQTAAVLEAFQRGDVDPEAARHVLEHELLPAWQAQVDRLSAQSGDPVTDDLRQFAEARRNAVLALVRAAGTGEPRWVDVAVNWQLQAENIVLKMRLREASVAQSRSR